MIATITSSQKQKPTVAKILKEIGKPTETSKLATKVSKERDVSIVQAYRLIKKAWKDNEIKKSPLPDRGVLNYLPEMVIQTSRSKETLSFQDAFLYRCFKQLDEINEKNVTGNSLQAFQRLCSFINTLPSHLKDKLSPDIQQAKQELSPYMEILKLEEMTINSAINSALQNSPGHQPLKVIMEHRAYDYVENLVEKVSMLLHGEFERARIGDF